MICRPQLEGGGVVSEIMPPHKSRQNFVIFDLEVIDTSTYVLFDIYGIKYLRFISVCVYYKCFRAYIYVQYMYMYALYLTNSNFLCVMCDIE